MITSPNSRRESKLGSGNRRHTDIKETFTFWHWEVEQFAETANQG